MLRIALLNLMPNKEQTEADFAHACAESAEPVEFVLTKMDSHVTRHCSDEHMALYIGTAELRRLHDDGSRPIDGFIFSGAPFDWVYFDDVDYWPEACSLMDWLRSQHIPTLYVCWGAQAALHHFYGIDRTEDYPHKLSGVFPQQVLRPELPIFKDIVSPLCIPHSRHTSMINTDIDANPDIEVLVRSAETGISIAQGCGGLEFYLVGHQEYELGTLDREYHRDVARGLNVFPPAHYYEDNNPDKPIIDSWTANGRRVYGNWLNYYVKK